MGQSDRTLGTSLTCLVCCVWPMLWAIGGWWLRGALPGLRSRNWWPTVHAMDAPPVMPEREL